MADFKEKLFQKLPESLLHPSMLFQKPADKLLGRVERRLEALGATQQQIDFFAHYPPLLEWLNDAYSTDEKIHAQALEQFDKLPRTQKLIYAGAVAMIHKKLTSKD